MEIFQIPEKPLHALQLARNSIALQLARHGALSQHPPRHRVACYSFAAARRPRASWPTTPSQKAQLFNLGKQLLPLPFRSQLRSVEPSRLCRVVWLLGKQVTVKTPEPLAKSTAAKAENPREAQRADSQQPESGVRHDPDLGPESQTFLRIPVSVLSLQVGKCCYDFDPYCFLPPAKTWAILPGPTHECTWRTRTSCQQLRRALDMKVCLYMS